MILNQLLLAALCLVSSISAQESAHLVSGTSYDTDGSIAYATNRHGADGALFLDPYFIPHLLDLDGREVLDAGCGSAPWAVYAATNGANVFAIDLQEKMIELAKESVEMAGVADRVILQVGDVSELPCLSNFFNLSLSINVGCNLPSTIQIGEKMVGLGPHIKEMERVLKEGSMAIVTAPASFGTVFTNGVLKEKVFEHIFEILEKLPANPSPSEIVAHLNELLEVYRATFAVRNERLTLITDEKTMEPGEEIWRKLPGLTVPNRYHPESEYLKEFTDAGFIVKECFRPQFNNEVDRVKYNASMPVAMSLGEEYTEYHPFVIFSVIKNTVSLDK